MSEWISVKDRLPKEKVSVLLYWPFWSSEAIVGMLGYAGWRSDRALSEGPSPTHWMPLPDPPKEPTK